MAVTHITQTADNDDWQKIIHQHVESIDYGSIEIVIHDARIAHVNVTERFRFADKRQQPLADGRNKR
jgi:hypothetical protein